MSEEHLERRRQQILDAARRCFIRGGIRETSMQEIFAESGLSAGAVYRYFKGKNDIIRAITASVIGNMHHDLGELVSADPILPPDEIVDRMTRHMVDQTGPDGTMRLAPQVWALAMHDPDLGGYVRANLVAMREHWITYATRCVRHGLLPPETDPVAAGKTLFGLLPGFLLQRLITGDIDPDELRAGVRTLLRPSMIDSTPQHDRLDARASGA